MRQFLSFITAMTLLTPMAHARRCASVDFPEAITVHGQRLVLNGVGLREASILQHDVYVAGLYLETSTRDAETILSSDTIKRLVLRFVHPVDRDDVVSEVRTGFERNAPRAERSKVERVLSWARDMREGSTMVFTYAPGRGTTVAIDDMDQGTIAGPEFGRAVFSLFVGPRPPNRGLRSGLLGGPCE